MPRASADTLSYYPSPEIRVYFYVFLNCIIPADVPKPYVTLRQPDVCSPCPYAFTATSSFFPSPSPSASSYLAAIKTSKNFFCSPTMFGADFPCPPEQNRSPLGRQGPPLQQQVSLAQDLKLKRCSAIPRPPNSLPRIDHWMGVPTGKMDICVAPTDWPCLVGQSLAWSALLWSPSARLSA